MKTLKALFVLMMLSSLVLAGDGNNHFFQKTDQFLKTYVKSGKVNYSKIRSNGGTQLAELVKIIATTDAASIQDATEKKAFWINAYNIIVIKSVIDNYPLKSPLDVNGFFDKKKHDIGGESLTLNDLEHKRLRKEYAYDARLHFVLVCAALGCPVLIEDAYTTVNVDELLEERTRIALNSTQHVRVDAEKKKVYVSELFKWYRDDFVQGGISEIEYLNKFRKQAVPTDYSLDYIRYDWTLNELTSASQSTLFTSPTRDNLQAYTPSTLLRRGQFEIKQFNNLYTQTASFNDQRQAIDQNRRSTFFTGITNVLFGINTRLNVGFDVYFRSVRNDATGSSPFALFEFASGNDARSAISQVGPKIKVNPFASIPNLSVQSAVLFPLADDLDGNEDPNSPFLDFDDMQWFTQLFYDKTLSRNSLLYFESGVFFRFGSEFEDFFTPLKAIYSYFPTAKATIYANSEFTPFWDGGSINAYFGQLGLGGKYQLLDSLEIELLYTDFLFGKNQGAGQTYNIGFRIIR